MEDLFRKDVKELLGALRGAEEAFLEAAEDPSRRAPGAAEDRLRGRIGAAVCACRREVAALAYSLGEEEDVATRANVAARAARFDRLVAGVSTARKAALVDRLVRELERRKREGGE